MKQQPNSWYVPDTIFNRAGYPHCIGRHFAHDNRPPYAQIRPSKLESIEYLCSEQDIVIAQACVKVIELAGRCRY